MADTLSGKQELVLEEVLARGNTFLGAKHHKCLNYTQKKGVLQTNNPTLTKILLSKHTKKMVDPLSGKQEHVLAAVLPQETLSWVTKHHMCLNKT